MNTLKPTLIFFAVLMSTMGLFGATNDTNEPPDVQERRTKFREMFDRLQPIHIYGKVIDQEGHPVSDADVMLSSETAIFLVGKHDFTPQTTWLKSDEEGLWTFKIDKPHRAFVTEVKKMGYNLLALDNFGSAGGNLVEHKTTPSNPVVTVLRKKGETTFLIIRPTGNRPGGDRIIRVLSPHSQTNTLDLLAEKGDKTASGKHADLQTAVYYDVTTGEWTVTYSASNGADGIVISTNLLYEAPQDGYQKEVVLKGPPWPRYLYVRSRTPAIYTRLDLEHSIWKGSATNQVLSISFEAWINPYGDRNLEYESDLSGQWQLRKQLESEAKADLLKNKRPVKPDLSKLIKEAKDKADKGKQ